MDFADDLKVIHRDRARQVEKDDGARPRHGHPLHPGVASTKGGAAPDIDHPPSAPLGDVIHDREADALIFTLKFQPSLFPIRDVGARHI